MKKRDGCYAILFGFVPPKNMVRHRKNTVTRKTNSVKAISVQNHLLSMLCCDNIASAPIRRIHS